MPRHLLTRRDSSELKFKITRLPSNDSFININNDRYTSSSQSQSHLDASFLNLSGGSSASGTSGLWPSPKTATTNTILSPSLSTSSSSPPSPPKQLINTDFVEEALHYNTSSDNMSTNTVSVSMSSGVLGVKKNFLHRAFQRNFSPGKIYRDQENTFVDSSDKVVTTFDARSSPMKMESHSPTKRMSKSRNNEIYASPERSKTVLTNLVNSPHKISSRGFHSSSPMEYNLSNSNSNSKTLPKQKSPSKKVSLLKFSSIKEDTENSHSLYGPNCTTNTPNHIHNNTENTKPHDRIIQFKVKNSPKSKTKLYSSPRKLESKQFPVISSPRKLDFPSSPIRRQSLVNTSSHELCSEDIAMPKLDTHRTLEKSSENATNQDCQPKLKVAPHQESFSQQKPFESLSSHITPEPKQEQTMDHHNDNCSPPIPSITPCALTRTTNSTKTLPNPTIVSKTTHATTRSVSNVDSQQGPTPQTIVSSSNSDTSTASIKTHKGKMAFPYLYPYQFFYAQGVTIPTASPQLHPYPHMATPSVNPHPHTPSVNPHMATPSVNPHPHTPSVNPHMATPSVNPHMATPSANPHMATPSVNPHMATPSANPHPHTLTPSINTHSQMITPSVNPLRLNDSGYQTPSFDFGKSSSSSSSQASTCPSTSAFSNASSSKSSSHSNQCSITNGIVPIASTPSSSSSSSSAAAGYLPTVSATPSTPASVFGAANLPPTYYTSTPYFQHNAALIHQGANQNLFHASPHAMQLMNPTVMHHMAYLSSLQALPSFPYAQPRTSQSVPQATPLDLSASEEPSPAKTSRKILFPIDNTSKTTRHANCSPDTAKASRRQKEDKNPFGINRILGVEDSPIKNEINVEDVDEIAFNPPPAAKPKTPKTRRKRKSPSSSPTAANAKKSKKSRDRPPLWGEEIAETQAVFYNCPEKAIFCDHFGNYVVPEIPEVHEEQEQMMSSLINLFKHSNLPTVPTNLRTNIFGLRYYPMMQTIFQAARHIDSKTVKTACEGLAFDNFRAITDNTKIDGMLKKEGDVYVCLTKKCIDPLDSLCTFTATSLGKMRRHIKNHLPNKKWVCAFCRTQMTDQTDMARHGTTHTLLKPYPCDYCDKVFSQKITLKGHMRKAHKIEKANEDKEEGEDKKEEDKKDDDKEDEDKKEEEEDENKEDDNKGDEKKNKKKKKDKKKGQEFTCRPCGKTFKEGMRMECIEHLWKFHLRTRYKTLMEKKKYPFEL